ncbi:MAG: RNA polymerase factor sigma-32 [Bacteriovoracaceae bacterium]|nr:RNA polymerase factor sigma-32 [Bacteriovoracaceae bacterium]
MSSKKKKKNSDIIIPTIVEDETIDNDEEETNEKPEISEDDIIEISSNDKETDLESKDNSLSEEELLPANILSKELAPYKPSKDLDPFTHYIRQINQYDLLSPEQEKALTKALVETGDIKVAKELVVANLRLVVKIAMEYRYAYSNIMDLIQEGNIGLMKAVSKYNPEKGAKLSYYASWWIKSYILKFILDNFRLVKIGTTNEQKKLFYNLVKEKNRLEGMGIVPDSKLISENLGVSEKSVKLMDKRLGERGGEVSIDKPINSQSDSRATLGDIISDQNSVGIEEEIAQKQGLEILQENLKDFVDGLKERDQEIFKKRLLSEIPPSLQSIADEYGVSRERIRQIEERLLKNLKVYMSDFIR